MTKDEIRQRVRYLSEFGGLHHAAGDEQAVLRWVKAGVWLAGICAALAAVAVTMHLLGR